MKLAGKVKAFVLFVALAGNICAQNGTPDTISLRFENTPLIQIIEELNRNYAVSIFYPPRLLKNKTISVDLNRASVGEVLQEITKPHNLRHIPYRDNLFIITEKPSATNEYLAETGKKEIYSIEGRIKSTVTGEYITGGNVYVQETGTGAITDKNGYFAFQLPEGTYHIAFSSMGLETHLQEVVLDQPKQFEIELAEKTIELTEITVFGERPDKNIRDVETGMVKVSSRSIEKFPSFMGETDILKSIVTLPGVTSVSEVSSGFNVRGGSVDQNLILLDDAPILNPAHLFGFFSVFNSDAVQDVSLYRGGIPARYGGRLSSVLDISHKSAHPEDFRGYGGIGFISGKLTLEIPIIKYRTSALISGRSTYSDWLLDYFPDEDLINSSADFYDGSLKINHMINTRNRISLTGYMSRDKFRYALDTLMLWGVQNFTLKWTHTFSPKLVASFTGVSSNNYNTIEGMNLKGNYTLDSDVRYRNLKADLSWNPVSEHFIGAGIGLTSYTIHPGDLETRDFFDRPRHTRIDPEDGLETAIYIQDEYSLSSRFAIKAGIRFSLYSNLGPQTVSIYDDTRPMDPLYIENAKHYNKWENIKTYGGIEPRISFRYSFSDNSSMKASYHKINQYIHLISNTTTVSPIHVWKLSDYHIKPQTGYQYSLGYFMNFRKNMVEGSAEIYYKGMDRIIDYKNGAILLLNRHIETELLQGEGRAYGIELMFKKNSGRLTGWTSYALSRSERKIQGSFPEETINRGEYYTADFDKTHELNLIGNYQFTRRWSSSFSFVYGTGRAISYPASKYRVFGYGIPDYPERNQFRIPDYHRLDLSLTLDGNLKRNKKWHGSYTFSVYNVYGRKNALSYFFNNSGTNTRAYKLSVLGSAFPAFTYNFRF